MHVLSVLNRDNKMRIIRYDEVPDEVRGDGAYTIKRLFTEELSVSPENVGFYQTTILQDSKVAGHHHVNLDEIFYFLTYAKLEIEGKIYNFKPKDMVFLKAGEKHEIYGGEKGAVLIAIKFPDLKEDKVLY